MALTLVTGVLVIFLTSLEMGRHAAFRIDISSKKFNTSTEDAAVQISCLVDSADTLAQRIYLLELYKEGEEIPIVYIGYGSPTFTDANQKRLTANGHIGNDVSKNYLTLTLGSPETDDYGVYTCSMLSLDNNGILKEKKANGTLSNENLYMSRMETVLLEKMTSLEEKLAQKNSILIKRIAAVEKKAEEIENLKEKVTYRAAFYARRKGIIHPVKGQTLVFPVVIMKEGDGYDGQTGIFTSPRSGLYTFNLAVRMCKADQWIYINLMANNRLIGTLYAADKGYRDQSFINVIVKLDKGDQVKPVVLNKHTDGRLFGETWSYFNGYLIQPL